MVVEPLMQAGFSSDGSSDMNHSPLLVSDDVNAVSLRREELSPCLWERDFRLFLQPLKQCFDLMLLSHMLVLRLTEVLGRNVSR